MVAGDGRRFLLLLLIIGVKLLFLSKECLADAHRLADRAANAVTGTADKAVKAVRSWGFFGSRALTGMSFPILDSVSNACSIATSLNRLDKVPVKIAPQGHLNKSIFFHIIECQCFADSLCQHRILWFDCIPFKSIPMKAYHFFPGNPQI